MSDMQRREFITLFGSAAAALPFAARAEQPTTPVVGLINAGAESAADRITAFRKGLNEAGYVEGQSVAIEYHWAECPFLQQSADGIWTAPSGAKVAWLKDPDGNLLSLTEPKRG
ncbi:MAG TPA: hypothetical protein VGI47_05580 [Candidatus Binataceae bacterium]|jgi:hypothetical protein